MKVLQVDDNKDSLNVPACLVRQLGHTSISR